MSSQYMTSAELEEVYNLPKGTAAQLRYRGGGPEFIRLGSRIRYKREAVEAWIEANTFTSTAA